MLPYFKEACQWAISDPQPADVFLLLGHWNVATGGCPKESTTPSIYEQLKEVEECISVHPKMKFIMGHTHCNHEVRDDVGYIVGGQGKSSGCMDFGLPIFDTTGIVVTLYK